MPDLIGPSVQGVNLVLSANRDVLVADGRDFAVITATVQGPDGRPAPNKDVFFAVANALGQFVDQGVIVGSNGPGTGATVRTNSAGIAQVIYEAPPRTDATADQTILIVARLVGNDANGVFYNSVRIELRSAQPKIFPNPGGGPGACDFIVEPATGPYHIGQVLSFQDTSAMANIIRYQWDFGDGTSVEDPDTAHVYRSAGFFTVTHTVTDFTGLTAGCFTTIPVQ